MGSITVTDDSDCSSERLSEARLRFEEWVKATIKGTLVLCPICGGKGWLDYYVGGIIRCFECHGTRFVERRLSGDHGYGP